MLEFFEVKNQTRTQRDNFRRGEGIPLKGDCLDSVS